MIPDQNYWETLSDELGARFLNMDIHQFILDSGFDIHPAIRKLYNPGIYNELGYDLIGISDVFYLSVLDGDNVRQTTDTVGAESVQIGTFASGGILIQFKGDNDQVKIWDYGPDNVGKVFQEYDAATFQKLLMPVGAKNRANNTP